jgi:hypothetical protein
MAKMKPVVYGLLFFLAGIGPLGAADLENGFLGIQWGTDISELPHFVQLSDNFNVTYYVDPRKSYTLFDVDVLEVVYGFYDQKLFATYINIESLDLFSRLKQHITEKYGLPRTTLNVINEQTEYVWNYKNTRIKLKHYEKLGKMKLGFYYTPLAAQVNVAQREAFPEVRQPTFPLDDRRLRDALDVMGF